MRSSTKIAIGIIAICVVALILALTRPSPEPDTLQIRDQLYSGIEGANQHSIGRIMSVISVNYQDENNQTADSLRSTLSAAFSNVPSIWVTTTEPVIDVTGNTATTESTITVRDDSEPGPPRFSQPVQLKWKKEPAYRLLLFPTAEWRIVGAENYGSLQNVDQ